MAISSTSFKAGHAIGKRSRRRVAYDSIFAEALETDGALFVQKIREHRDSEDPSISLKACDVFFKYARPPEVDDLTSPPDTSQFRDLGLTLEEGLRLKKELQENQTFLIGTLSDKIIRDRGRPHVG